MKCMKGQYFSFDAIMAAVIFILGIAMLSGYWFSVRNTADPSSNYLHQDALRISDILLSSPDPVDWYDKLETSPQEIGKIGLGMKGRPSGILNKSMLKKIGNIIDFNRPLQNGVAYDRFRNMLGTGGRLNIIVIEASDDEAGYHKILVSNPNKMYSIGGSISNNKKVNEEVVVRRIVAIEDDSGNIRPGIMWVTVWSEKN